MYDSINYEISGFCNARCKYCQTGCNDGKTEVPKFVYLEEIKNTIQHLKLNNLIGYKTQINLYNWGEPTLHPQYKEIIKFFMKESFCNISISTNMAKLVLFKPNIDDLSGLKRIIISMPGFSQESYDRIHKFDFEMIKNNIKTMVENLKACGYKNEIHIAYHVYQFNLHEYKDALDFAIENSLSISADLAYINDGNRTLKHAKKQIPYDELFEMSGELLLNDWPLTITPVSRNYPCPQYDLLTIDSDSNVITCCVYSEVYKKVLDIKSKEEVNAWAIDSKTCVECRAFGIMPSILDPDRTSWTAKILPSINDRIASKILDLKFRNKFIYDYFKKMNYKDIIIYGAGTQGKLLYFELKNSNVCITQFIDKNTRYIDEIEVTCSDIIFNLESSDNLKSDVIVVTTQMVHYNKVIDDLKKVTSTPIITLTDILRDFSNWKTITYC